MPRLRLSPNSRRREERDPLFDPKRREEAVRVVIHYLIQNHRGGRRSRRDTLFDPPSSSRSNRVYRRQNSTDGARIDPLGALGVIIVLAILAALIWLAVVVWNLYAWVSNPTKVLLGWILFFPFSCLDSHWHYSIFALIRSLGENSRSTCATEVGTRSGTGKAGARARTTDTCRWAKELDIQIIDGETLVRFKERSIHNSQI